METESIEQLTQYARENIGRITRDNPNLRPIFELIQTLPRQLSSAQAITDDNAERLTKFSQSDAIPEIFSPEELATIHKIARKILELAVKHKDDNTSLQKVVSYLHPLLSQDSRTEQIGWDLEEYMDWYFTTPTETERKARAHELLSDWQLDTER